MREPVRVRLGTLAALVCLSLVTLSVACSSSDPKASSGDDDDDDNSSSSGGTSSGGTSSGGTSSGDTGPASAFATQICARIERCFPGSVASSWGDAATCQKLYDKFIGPQKALAGSGMTEAALNACAEKFKTADCSLVQNEIPECRFKGTVKTGEDCSLGVQCETGLCVYASQTATCGKCTATVPLGGTCENDECEPPSFCDSGGTNKCINAPGENGDCSNYDCAGGLSCVGNKCVKPIAKDGACTPPTSPFENPCAQGLSCIDGKCGLTAVTAKTGEACSPPKTACIEGACLDNKCVAALEEGAACDASSDIPPFCEPPMACVGGKCTSFQVTTCK
ncbi:MAG: hypothetical protein U0270_18825 [Labilithrix sp.]